MPKQKTRSERKGQKERAARAASHGLPQAAPAPVPVKVRALAATRERGLGVRTRRVRKGQQGLPGGRFPTLARVGVAVVLIIGALYWVSSHRGL